MLVLKSKATEILPTGSSLHSIQMLRAIAALAVLLSHLSGSLSEFGYTPNPVPKFDYGAIGVDLFFVISGFIMVYTSERLFAKSNAPRVFFSRRVIRIFPLYWALTALAVFGWHGLTLPPFLTWKNVVGSFLLIPTTRPTGGVPPVIIQGWTLYYEMFFYALFAIVIVFPRSLAVLTLTGLFVALVSASSFLTWTVPWSIWSAPIVYEFVFGMWIALLYRAGWRLHPGACVGLAVAAVTLTVIAHLQGLINEEPLTHNYSRPLIWGVGAAAVVASFVLADVARTVPATLRPLIVLGDASYALYLFHSFIPFGLYAIHAPRIIDPAAYPFGYSALTAGLAILSALLLNVFDGRFRGWLLAKTRLRPSLVAVPS